MVSSSSLDWLIDFICWLIDWLIDCWYIVRLIDWLIHSIIYWPSIDWLNEWIEWNHFIQGIHPFWSCNLNEIRVIRCVIYSFRVKVPIALGFSSHLFYVIGNWKSLSIGSIFFKLDNLKFEFNPFYPLDFLMGSWVNLFLFSFFALSGSVNQTANVYNFLGTQLSSIKHYDGFMGQRIGSVSSVAFHPFKVLVLYIRTLDKRPLSCPFHLHVQRGWCDLCGLCFYSTFLAFISP